METLALDGFWLGGVLERGDDLLHLGGSDGEVGRGRPDTVAFGVEDGGLVQLAGADQAERVLEDKYKGWSGCSSAPGINICYRAVSTAVHIESDAESKPPDVPCQDMVGCGV